jgi:hypothetical protein
MIRRYSLPSSRIAAVGSAMENRSITRGTRSPDGAERFSNSGMSSPSTRLDVVMSRLPWVASPYRAKTSAARVTKTASSEDTGASMTQLLHPSALATCINAMRNARSINSR